MRMIGVSIALLLLASCSNVHEPVSTGGGTDDLPSSPCACDEPFYENGVWLS